ncbi:MAG TPA: aminoglycoside phosphotransferase family protein [Streptosporangiaceae bacterium]|nr:aminoglycoside phosphotransferase family protein [Streptosporangiaceae bacterium]
MDVESRLRACQGAWQLQSCRGLDSGFRSNVFSCVTAAGEHVVVRLAATPADARAEAAALRAWAHTGAAVRLIEADLEHGALLLEQIRPATQLPSHDDDTAVCVAASILSELHPSALPTFAFPSLADSYAGHEQRARDDIEYEQRTREDPNRGLAGYQRLDAAREMAMTLCGTADYVVLLHGDFIDKNLLWNGARYVAIDPIPSIGDPCADVGLFAAYHLPAGAILERAGAIADRMGLTCRRAQSWAAIWTVLQTCQAWREDQAELEAIVATDRFESLLHE